MFDRGVQLQFHRASAQRRYERREQTAVATERPELRLLGRTAGGPLLDDGAGACAPRVGGIEPLCAHPRVSASFVRELAGKMAIEEAIERQVAFLERVAPLHGDTNLPEKILRLDEPTVAQRPALAARIDRCASGFRDEIEGRGGASVYELGSELDRHRHARLFMRPDAAADALSRFDEERVLAGTRKLGSRGKAGRARADDDHVVVSGTHENRYSRLPPRVMLWRSARGNYAFSLLIDTRGSEPLVVSSTCRGSTQPLRAFRSRRPS